MAVGILPASSTAARRSTAELMAMKQASANSWVKMSPSGKRRELVSVIVVAPIAVPGVEHHGASVNDADAAGG